MESIKRVDEMVRKSNAKYICNIQSDTEQKQKKQQEKQVQQYQKQQKKNALKSYTEIVKQQNKKTIEKIKQRKETKQRSKKSKKNKKKETIKEQQIENIEQNMENKKNKYNDNQIKQIQAAIKERAQTIIHQKHLDRLDKHLAQQKKKTKLYELNEKCKKIIKSNIKIPPLPPFVSQNQKMILQQFQKTTMEEIQKLDLIIGDIIFKKNNKQQQLPSTTQIKNKSIPKTKIYHKNINNLQHLQLPLQQQKPNSTQDLDTCSDPFINSPIFTKSTEQLLSLQYIPI